MALYLAFIACLSLLAWRNPDLRQSLEPDALAQTGRDLLAMPMGPLMVLGGYVVAVMMGLPIALLVTVGVLVFGPWPGMAYALIGMLSGAVVTYGIGRFSGATLVDRWAGTGRVHALASALKRRGLWAVIVIRAVPVAPFVVVNLAAGAFRIRFVDYVLGTFLGLMPGTIVLALLMDRIKAALAKPDATTYGVLVGVVVLLVLGGWLVRRLLVNSQTKTP